MPASTAVMVAGRPPSAGQTSLPVIPQSIGDVPELHPQLLQAPEMTVVVLMSLLGTAR